MPPDEVDPPVPLHELRRASTEQLLDRHVGVPLRHLTAELMAEVAERIAAVLADLERVKGHSFQRTHIDDCWKWHAACLAARIRRTLEGTDHRG